MSADVVSYDVAKAVRDMGEVFRTRWPSAGAVAAYIRALDGAPPGDVVAACQLLIETHDGHMPKPAQVLKTVREIQARAGRPRGPIEKPPPETRYNPASGEWETVYNCRSCQDAGFVTVYDGRCVSWSEVRAGLVPRNTPVGRCKCKGGSYEAIPPLEEEAYP